MKKQFLVKQIKQHIKDGFIKSACNMMRELGDKHEKYCYLYIYLSQMIISLQQNTGVLSHDAYISYLMLNHPYNLKGGVKDE